MEKFTIDELKKFAESALRARERAKASYVRNQETVLARKKEQYEQKKLADPNAPKRKQGRPRKYFPPEDAEGKDFLSKE